jgi:hypothetical protein
VWLLLEPMFISVLRFIVTANFVPSYSNLVTLMMEGIHYSEKSVLTRVIRHHIPEDGVLLKKLFSHFSLMKTV